MNANSLFYQEKHRRGPDSVVTPQMTCHGCLGVSGIQQRGDLMLVETEHLFGALAEDGPFDEVGFPGHQLDGLRACGRMLLHVHRAVEVVASVEEFRVRPVADQRVQFRFV